MRGWGSKEYVRQTGVMRVRDLVKTANSTRGVRAGVGRVTVYSMCEVRLQVAPIRVTVDRQRRRERAPRLERDLALGEVAPPGLQVAVDRIPRRRVGHCAMAVCC